MDTLLDGIFHGLFTAVDPLGMVLRTLMALLADVQKAEAFASLP